MQENVRNVHSAWQLWLNNETGNKTS